MNARNIGSVIGALLARIMGKKGYKRKRIREEFGPT